MMDEYFSAMSVYVYDIICNESSLSVRPGLSWIDDKMIGLFATKDIEEEEIIDSYKGRLMRTAEALGLKEKSYLMRLGEQKYIDAANSPFCLARYINDCRNSAGYNVKFIKAPENNLALVVCLRKIRRGEEIFVDYGKWYWLGCSFSSIRLSFRELNKRREIAYCYS